MRHQRDREKLFFLDLETTGTSVNRHSIHQISGMIVIDGEIAERFDYHVRPHEKCIIEAEALERCNVTEAQILSYRHRDEIFVKVEKMLARHVNRYDRTDKMHIVGYNNRSFDDAFFRRWFDHCGNDYFGSWFWPDSFDVLVLASYYLRDRRNKMENFQLHTVARTMGIDVDETRLHDAAYDIDLTYDVFEIAVGREIEL